MANAEINDLDPKATPALTDEIELQETSGGLSFKTTFAGIKALFDTLFAPLSHITNVLNPHAVTKTQVGLGNVTDNAQVVAAASTDNRLMKRDGVAGQVQDTGITVSDEDRVSGAGVVFREVLATGLTLLADDGKTLKLNNAAAQVLTVDSNANAAIPVGGVINLTNEGAGTWTIGIATDTLNQKDGTFDLAAGAVATLLKTDTTTWRLFGDLA